MAATAKHDDIPSNESCWSLMWICRLCLQVSEQRGQNVAPGDAADRRRGARLMRVRAADTQETIWQTVVSGRTARSGDRFYKRRSWGLNACWGWGSEGIITWLLERGYQVTGKFKSSGRVRKLIGAVTTWHPTSSPGREVAPVPKPVTFVRPLQQYAVRTPSK
jgi:hypothetical protein